MAGSVVRTEWAVENQGAGLWCEEEEDDKVGGGEVEELEEEEEET